MNTDHLHLTVDQVAELPTMGPLGEEAAYRLQKLRADRDSRFGEWQYAELHAALVYWTIKKSQGYHHLFHQIQAVHKVLQELRR